MTTANTPGPDAGNQSGTQAEPQQQTPQTPQEPVSTPTAFSQDDLDSAAAAARRKAEAELEKAKGELEKLRKAQMNEQERAIEEAKAQVAQAKDAEFTRYRVESEVRLKLTQMGLDPDFAHTVLALETIDDPSEAAEVAEKVAKAKGWKTAAASAPGQAGQPVTGSPLGNQQVSGQDIAKLVASGEYEKHRDEIVKAMREGRLTR